MTARSYRLGIDLGTTYTAAAVCREAAGSWSAPEIVALGSQSASVASVLYLGADGTVLVGEAAERRGISEPDRVVRQFKRRIGDDVPLVVGDAVHTAHDLAARMGRWVVDKVAEREGGPADAVAVTHPAAWGGHKKDLLAGALRGVGLERVTFLPEPQAAAIAYSARERVDAGGAVAVYDLGGGTFDAAVVRRADGGDGGFELPGRAEGIEQLGGVDFDDRVFDHVRAGIGAGLDELDFEDPDVLASVLRLRRDCVEAKEALSFDTQATIPVMLPGIRTTIRLTRVEFEAAIRGSIDHTVDALRRSVESARLTSDQLQAVLLVGGSSRIPLVAQRISEELGRPVAVDSDPKTAIAVGAVLTVAPRPAPLVAAVASPPVAEPAAPPPGPPAPSAPVPAAPVRPAPTPAAGMPAPAARVAAGAPASYAPAPGAPPASVPRDPSGQIDLRALQAQAARSAPAPHGGHPPAPSTSAPPVPPRPPVGPDRLAAGPPASPGYVAPPAWSDEDEDDDEGDDGTRRKLTIIAVVFALLVFAAAFAIGVWMKVGT